MCWITGAHTIYPPIEGLLPPASIEPTPFRNSASKVAELQVHATTDLLSLEVVHLARASGQNIIQISSNYLLSRMYDELSESVVFCQN